jgi:uncharacterized coiled-coil protein SlyX
MRRAWHGGGWSNGGWRIWAAASTLALWVFPAAAADETVTLYQWTDAKGVTRYTPDLDRIPAYARASAVAIQPGAAPEPTTPQYFEPDPRAPSVAVPGEPPATVRGAAPAPAATVPASGREQRIRELEARIAEDEEALKQLISAPGEQADVAVSPELREIAARLPRLQAELASLQQQSAAPHEP